MKTSDFCSLDSAGGVYLSLLVICRYLIMSKFRTSSVLFLLGLMTFPAGSQAANASATLVASRGEVKASSAGVDRVLTQGSAVFVEDQVITGDKSFAILQFIDGAKVTVRPKSKIIIEQYVFNGGDEDAATLNLVEGGLRIITGAMTKTHPESYKVKTPVALMGVRGTEFAIMLCGDHICDEKEIPDEEAITD